MAQEPSRLEILALQRYKDQLQKQADLKRDFGLMFYEPHYKQDLFHQAAEIKSRFMRTGNRFGKSLMGVAEDCAFALGYRPWYEREFDVLDGEGKVVRHHDPVKDAWMIHHGLPRRSVKILIICADWDKAEEIFTNQVEGEGKGKLFKVLPKDKIVKVEKNQSGKICSVHVESKWGGVSVITLDTIKSWKSNPMGQESGDVDVIHVDEPCPEKMFKANARGLVDRDGWDFFTCTPLNEMWISDRFLPEGNIRSEFAAPKVHSQNVIGVEIKRWICTGSMNDNPMLSRESKANFISSLTDSEIATRIDGRPAELSGVIYREFKPEIHVLRKLPTKEWKDYDSPPENYTIRIAIDTHPVNPHAVLFAATAPTGHVFFFNEFYDSVLIPQLASETLERLRHKLPHRCLVELAAYNGTPLNEGITMADELFNGGLINLEPAVKDLQYGILRVRQELARRDMYGNPILNFSPYLARTIREFDRYIYDDNGKVLDKNDHMMECLYRLVLTGLEHVEPSDATNQRVKPLDMSKIVNRPMPKLSLSELDKGFGLGAKSKGPERYPKAPLRRL